MYSGFVTGVQVNSTNRCQENDTRLLQISICRRPCKCVSSVLAMFLKFLMIKSPTHCLGRFCKSHLGLGDQSQGVKSDAKGTRSRIINQLLSLCCVFFETAIHFPIFPAKSLSGDFCLKILDVQIRTAYVSSHLQPTMAPHGFGMWLGVSGFGDEMRVQ